jgi:lipoic acid synthetase
MACTTPAARARKPDWLRVRLPTSPEFARTSALVHGLSLTTVCEEAACPNRFECWSRGTATFMVGGGNCTRNCGFCNVATARPLPLEADEPARVAEAAGNMNLRHIVLTMVARDDLPDGASEHVARTMQAVRARLPRVILEVLVSDFNGRPADIDRVLDARPDIFAHNLETVERLTPSVRSRARYARSLAVLARGAARDPLCIAKSGLMLGWDETPDEIRAALRDLRAAGVRVLTLGQYLQPSPRHLPVGRWVTPDEFDQWAAEARALGFASVASGPLVRSSYYADAVNLDALRA